MAQQTTTTYESPIGVTYLFVDCGHDRDATCRYCGVCHECDPVCYDTADEDRFRGDR